MNRALLRLVFVCITTLGATFASAQNLLLGATVTDTCASCPQAQFGPPGAITDGDVKTNRNLGGGAPGSFMISLAKPIALGRVVLLPNMTPNGQVSFEIQTSTNPSGTTGTWTSHGGTVSREWADKLAIDVPLNPQTTGVRMVKVIVHKSPAWVSLYEVEGYSSPNPGLLLLLILPPLLVAGGLLYRRRWGKGDLPKTTLSNSRHVALYSAYVSCIGLALVVLSEQITFLDSGDFFRTVAFMLTHPLDGTGRLWEFRPEGFQRPDHFESGVFFFGLFGYLQQWTSGIYFDVRWQSISAKVLLLWLGHLMAVRIAALVGLRLLGQAFVFSMISMVLFQAHNIGVLKSFYNEYATLLGCVVLVLGLLTGPGTQRALLIVLGAFLFGISKVQFFYVPALVLVCLAWQRLRLQLPLSRPMIAALLCVQTICVLPSLHNPYQQLNYHHATYYGAYLLLSPDELRDLGLNAAQVDCVGLDAWGNKAAGPGGSTARRENHSCFGKQTLKLHDVLSPYLQHPTLLWRLAAYALPHHFTVQYFHVFKELRYIVPADRISFGYGRWLVQLSELRDAYVTRAWPLLVAAGLLAGLLRLPGALWLGTASLFLALFIPSQMVVSLLGEGIRDLSKHLWAAQLALDLLTILVATQIALLLRQWLPDRRKALREQVGSV